MKKIFTLLFISCLTSTVTSIAQTIATECHLTASFNYQFDPVHHNKVFFVNQSTPASSVTTIKWTFGDGTSSTLLNPDHVYARPGVYNVCIRVTSGNNCVKEFCKTVEVKQSEINCEEISKFNIIRSTGNCLEFKFVPVIQNRDWKYVWTFGDGTVSDQMLPAHLYPRSGNYTVSLKVIKSSTCSSSSHKIAETGNCTPCKEVHVKFEYRKESANSNRYFFHAVSKHSILSQRWTITKLNAGGATPVTLNTNNPDFVFSTPGDYRVCLRAVTAGNCVKEYCEIIHISAPRSECIISSYPNPAHNNVNLAVHLAEPSIIHVYIYNSLNTMIKHVEKRGVLGKNIVTTNIESLHPGIYTIKVIYGNKVCYSKFQKI